MKNVKIEVEGTKHRVSDEGRALEFAEKVRPIFWLEGWEWETAWDKGVPSVLQIQGRACSLLYGLIAKTGPGETAVAKYRHLVVTYSRPETGDWDWTKTEEYVTFAIEF